MNQEFSYSEPASTSTALSRVFGWMGLALAITALLSFGVYLGLESGLIDQQLYGGLLIGAVVVYFLTYLFVMFSGLRGGRGNALIPFILYAASFGVLLSTLPFVYPYEMIATAFGISAFVFGAFALYGAVTKQNLNSLGQFAIVALLGAIILMVINLFIRSQPLDILLSFVVFGAVLLIVAYQVWVVKQLAGAGMMTRNQEIMAALGLYISFMNIFLRILRFLAMSRRR
jgi:FtsH-binding integral membrane protein